MGKYYNKPFQVLMKQFFVALTEFKQSIKDNDNFTDYLSNKYDLISTPLNALDFSDDDVNKMNQLQNNQFEKWRVASDTFEKEIEVANLDYGHKFGELLIDSVTNKDWDQLYMLINIYSYKKVKSDIAQEISWCIEEVLKRDEIGNWAKGTIMEDMVKLYVPSVMNHSIIKNTLIKVIETVNHDDLENYHLINQSKALLGVLV